MYTDDFAAFSLHQERAYVTSLWPGHLGRQNQLNLAIAAESGGTVIA